MLGPRARFGIVRSSRSAQSSLRVLLDAPSSSNRTRAL